MSEKFSEIPWCTRPRSTYCFIFEVSSIGRAPVTNEEELRQRLVHVHLSFYQNVGRWEIPWRNSSFSRWRNGNIKRTNQNKNKEFTIDRKNIAKHVLQSNSKEEGVKHMCKEQAWALTVLEEEKGISKMLRYYSFRSSFSVWCIRKLCTSSNVEVSLTKRKATCVYAVKEEYVFDSTLKLA